MSHDEEGVIDLFALHERGRASALPQGAIVRDVFSSPVPAVSWDLADKADDGAADSIAEEDDEDIEKLFARKPREKLALIAGAAGLLLLIVGIAVAGTSGGSRADAKASAAGAERATVPAVAIPAPSPLPVATPPASAVSVAAGTTAEPGASRSASTAAAARPLAQAKSRSLFGGGAKLTKVQSAGVASQ